MLAVAAAAGLAVVPATGEIVKLLRRAVMSSSAAAVEVVIGDIAYSKG